MGGHSGVEERLGSLKQEVEGEEEEEAEVQGLPCWAQAWQGEAVRPWSAADQKEAEEEERHGRTSAVAVVMI